MTKTLVFLLSLSLAAAAAHAQSTKDPLTTSNKFMFGMIKANIVKAAAKMPEENYSFRPTPDVRSFGELIGHVADAQYEFCAPVLGDKSPTTSIEKTKTSKADLIQALNDGFAYCDKAYNGMTDATATDIIPFFGYKSPKLSVLSFNSAHMDEHYGNIVTYMRLKKLVPPSSESQK